MANTKQDFLFELGTEELPPKALKKLSDALGREVAAGLKNAELNHGEVQLFATPRRLAVLVSQLDARQADKTVERRGPAVAAAFDDEGKPTQAAQGFARSCGVEVDQLETLETKKGAWLMYHLQQPGKPAQELLPTIVNEALAKLPIPKRMRWGNLLAEFVRPVHWLVMLFGDEIIDAEIYGVRSGRETRGHRFHHPEILSLSQPSVYATLLENEGQVMVDFNTRRETIRTQVLAAVEPLNGRAVIDDALLDEVTGMVEWPVAVVGDFDRRFLELPAEVLVSAMKSHQKYFHVIDEQGRLLPHFVTISNIQSRDIAVVRSGNERVIRPRLSDAVFFWEQDKKIGLAGQGLRLQSVVFQKKLGTLLDKTQRVTALCSNIAQQLDVSAQLAEQAAQLSKCDLMTDMVGEFPELQGIMGRYYAQHDGLDDAVSMALDEQYMPRHAGDCLPATSLGQALALADKLDTLTGLFLVNQIPSGTKDPFALRRASLGILRTIIENELGELDLDQLIGAALKSHQQGESDKTEVASKVFDFMMDRLRGSYLDQGISHDVFDAVLACRPARPVDFDDRIKAVTAFRALPDAESLAAANKRIANILRQSKDDIPSSVDESLLTEAAEQLLSQRLMALSTELQPLLSKRNYTEVLTRLATLRDSVDSFFDDVMVMVDDEAVRRNRLALLASLRRLFLQVADVSCLQG